MEMPSEFTVHDSAGQTLAIAANGEVVWSFADTALQFTGQDLLYLNLLWAGREIPKDFWNEGEEPSINSELASKILTTLAFSDVNFLTTQFMYNGQRASDTFLVEPRILDAMLGDEAAQEEVNEMMEQFLKKHDHDHDPHNLEDAGLTQGPIDGVAMPNVPYALRRGENEYMTRREDGTFAWVEADEPVYILHSNDLLYINSVREDHPFREDIVKSWKSGQIDRFLNEEEIVVVLGLVIDESMDNMVFMMQDGDEYPFQMPEESVKAFTMFSEMAKLVEEGVTVINLNLEGGDGDERLRELTAELNELAEKMQGEDE